MHSPSSVFSSARWLFVFFLLGTLPVLAAPKWLRLSARDFTIYSDASQGDLEKFALTYAAFRQVSRDLLLPPGKSAPFSTILLFRWDASFKKHLPPPKRLDIEWGAFTSEVDGLALTALSLSGDRAEALSTVFEFESVRTLRRQYPFLPLWLVQGSGQVLSSLEVRKGSVVLGDQPSRFFQHHSLPWDRVFDITSRSPEYRGQLDLGVYHAQAWALMHWVLLGDQNSRERLERVIRECGYVVPGKDIKHILDFPVEGLDGEIQRHLAGKKAKREIPFDRASLQAAWTVAPASELTIELYRIELLIAAGKPEEARVSLLHLAATNPDNPLVHETLARAALRDNDLSAASTHYRRAVELGSTNPTSLLRCASARLDESQTYGLDYEGNAGSNAAEAIVEIEKIISVDPANLDAYRLLGRALFLAPKITETDPARLDPGIGPGDEGARIRHYRALLYYRLGKSKEADLDLRKIVGDVTVSEEIKNQARQTFARNRPQPASR